MKGVLVRIGSSAWAAVHTVLAALDSQEPRYWGHGCGDPQEGCLTGPGLEH